MKGQRCSHVMLNTFFALIDHSPVACGGFLNDNRWCRHLDCVWSLWPGQPDHRNLMCIGLSGEYTNHQTGTLGITEITCVTVAVMLHRPENLSEFFKLSEDNMDVLHDGNGLTLLVRKQTFHGFNPDRSVRVNTPGNTFTTKYNAISYLSCVCTVLQGCNK